MPKSINKELITDIYFEQYQQNQQNAYPSFARQSNSDLSTEIYHAAIDGYNWVENPHLGLQKAHEAIENLPLLRDFRESCEGDPALASVYHQYIHSNFWLTLVDIMNSVEKIDDTKDERTQDQTDQMIQERMERGLAQMENKVEKPSAQQESRQLSKTIEAMDDVNQAFGKSPGLEDGDDFHNKRARLAQVFADNPEIKNVLNLAGRLREMAKGMPDQVQGQTDKEDELVQGRAPRELTRERALLASEQTRDAYYFRFATNRQWKRERSSKKPRGKGGIWLLRDKSGSMRECWPVINAFSSALTLTALKLRRKCQVFDFNARVRAVHTFPLDHKSQCMESLSSMVQTTASGGTSFDNLWTRVVSERPPKKTDVVFLTDGADVIRQSQSRKILAWKKKYGVRVIVVGVNIEIHDSLKMICDKQLRIDSTDPDDFAKFAEVIKDVSQA